MGLEVVAIARHGMLLRRSDRDPRGLLATKAVGRAGPAPGAKRRAEASAEDGEARLFCFAMQRPEGPAEKNRAQPLPGRTV
jgi:hypothetical protein